MWTRHTKPTGRLCGAGPLTTFRAPHPLLFGMDTSTPTRKSLWCRANLRHRWETAHTPDGARYVRCSRCLKERWTTPGANTVTGFSIGGGGG